MGRQKIVKILILFIFITTIIIPVFAVDFDIKAEPVENSEEFNQYLKLTDEEKEKVLLPNPIKTLDTETKAENPLNILRVVGSSLETRYSLKDVIKNNFKIKNQGNTNSCWAFASLDALETNLALKNNNSNIYDFSERHMEYATCRLFANGAINPNGYNRKPGDGGNWYISTTYLTNGSGAINEDQMPFKDNTDTINISEIQNKQVVTQVYDTISFPSLNATDDTSEIKQQIKEHIKAYGAVGCQIYGAQLISDYYNNDTGALYCDNSSSAYLPDHAVSIIGWDDNYSINNFNEGHRPKKPGAWIIKNNWGEKLELTLQTMKDEIFKANRNECINNGWTASSQIPDDVAKKYFQDIGYTINGNTASMKVGDNGYMYLSYEDINVYKNVFGIVKSDNKVSYDYIYQYDELGPNTFFQALDPHAYIGSVFNKKSTGKEYLTQVSVYAPETYTCKVYLNANGAGMKPEELKQVQLKAGSSETFSAGYHTLEFSEPVEINSSQYSVVLEINGTRSNGIEIALESNETGVEWYNTAKVESGKCFWANSASYQNNNWIDVSKISELNNQIKNGDTTIKAFSVTNIDKKEPEKEDPGNNNPNNNNNNNNNNPNNNGNNNNKEEKIENTDFSKAQCKVKKLEGYMFVDLNKEEYVSMDMEVNNINRNLKDNINYEYYYYLSANQAENNIKDWVKIKENQKESNKISFNIDTRDIKNMDEIENSENLYLYIKEVASKNGQEATVITKSMQIDSNLDDDVEVKLYVDNQDIDEYWSSSANWQSSNSGNYGNSKDPTTSTLNLPNAGYTILIGIMVIIAISGIIIYIRYKKLSKYIK